MKNNSAPFYSVLILTAMLFVVFYFMMPQYYDENEAQLSNFSTQRALEKVKDLSRKPHFIGSKSHEVIAQYLQNFFL